MRVEKTFRILLVDDESINLQVLTAALRDDYEIQTALTGYEALVTVKESKPDLILLDVMMPGLSGFEVCSALKQDPACADIPVIFVTAMDSMQGESQGLVAGGIDYLFKPVNIELLKLRVRNHIELKRRSDLLAEQRDLLASQKEALEEALARIKRLEGIIPICMYCKNIRNDTSVWQKVETYISEHSDARFSHGICPGCIAKHFPMIAPPPSENSGSDPA